MRLYMAPLEGLTNYIFRQTFASYYGGVDKFFTPFISPAQTKNFTTKEKNEISCVNNEGLNVVPQLMAKDPEHFIWAAGEIKKLGYDEINLNTGCPSGTVVAKGKGAGMLRDTDGLYAFFEEVFPELSKMEMKLSVKTRIGLKDPSEFGKILDVYNSFPFSEVIVHPRVREQFYKGEVNADAFELAVKNSKNPLVYNGDIKTDGDIKRISKAYPGISAIMVGRGILSNPALALGGKASDDIVKLKAFHDKLLRRFCEVYSGDSVILAHIKEMWDYLKDSMSNYEDYEKGLGVQRP